MLRAHCISSAYLSLLTALLATTLGCGEGLRERGDDADDERRGSNRPGASEDDDDAPGGDDNDDGDDNDEAPGGGADGPGDGDAQNPADPGTSDPCRGETDLGRCDGNTLVVCDGETVQRVDCGDEVCALVNEELGYRCAAPWATSILDAENPSFLCEEQSGGRFLLALHARLAVAVTADQVQHPGSYSFTNSGTMHLTLPGVVDATFDSYLVDADMILAMSAPGLTCEAYSYEVDSPIETTAVCEGSWIEIGFVYTDTTFQFHSDGSVTVYEDMLLGDDEIWSQFEGVYRVTGNEIGIAWLDDGETEGAVGYFDSAGTLVIPGFDHPACDG
ncbi:MAG: hypothetical protein IT383_18165 [Deltaproteobacteria bacterium]|nr:hypothetical protein [Deltaproteobacteria bacterium]